MAGVRSAGWTDHELLLLGSGFEEIALLLGEGGLLLKELSAVFLRLRCVSRRPRATGDGAQGEVLARTFIFGPICF